ncbi:hypothetical protein P3339_16080 [Microbulbifer sp. MLAF003]|uniref:hypothetical protein n=1 Tax=Microbulbifer sp. MLAF003 TaxID=3032582 RepID=UPI0024AE6DE1|nr:hypothetical protein [Microbulbifer sp. MLAF003]WHI49962.1 hypothetical protein P3339_16080 [Microbulbifer sp. MLAF003]
MDVSKLSIIHGENQWSDALAKLGGKYLVHLNPCNKESCKSMNADFSVIEVESFDASRPDFALVLKKLNLKKDNIQRYKGFYWYPVACVNQPDRKICKEAIKVLQSALRKENS